MLYTAVTVLLIKRITQISTSPKASIFYVFHNSLKPYSTSSSSFSPDPPKPSSLSARMSFVFDQIDAIERERARKDETLQKIRAWRQSKDTVQSQEQKPETVSTQNAESSTLQNESEECSDGLNRTENGDDSVEVLKKKNELEIVHPWPEWIELMQRLVQQNYFDHRRKDEDELVRDMGFDAHGVGDDGDVVGVDFRDFKTVQNACFNFGKDRFDILRPLSRKDVQVLVGYGCPSADKKVVFSAKLLRKHVHLDEGDVCSGCNLRNSCERAYLLTNKEDEARTVDVMRVLLTYGFDSINGSVVNKSLLKRKSLRTVVRKLLHEVVKLSAVPIDPNLPPPVIKRPPPKVKQPPPPPKRRVGRDDVEMKKGDWLCPKCDFMNFAKNTVCLQCDAKRPKRQLLQGEWECPECNFLNYRRNMACFHCDCKRPPDEFIEDKMDDVQRVHKTRLEKNPVRAEVSNAWNFDFDDDESDGADVAAFEYADPAAMEDGASIHAQAQGENFRVSDGDLNSSSRVSRVHERDFSEASHDRPRMGFDDFDDEDDVDSYELDTENNRPRWDASRSNFSQQGISDFEDDEGYDDVLRSGPRKTSPYTVKPSKPMHKKATFSHSEDDKSDIDSNDELSVHPKWKSSHVAVARNKSRGRSQNGPSRRLSFGSDEEIDVDSDADEDLGLRRHKGIGRRNYERSDMRSASFSNTESENDQPYSRRNRSGWNKMEADGRRNNFRESTKGRPSSRTADRRNSWNDDFGRSSRRPHDRNRGSRGNNNFTRSDREGSFRNFKGPKRDEVQSRRERRSHDYDIGSDKDFGEFRNSRRVIER